MTLLLNIAGRAQRASQVYPFEGSLTIGQNHFIPSPNPATPGVNPICKQRIVAPVPVGFALNDGGLLTIRGGVDPYDLLSGTDFSVLHLAAPPPAPPLYRFSNSIDNQADQNVYANLTTPTTYAVSWQSSH